MTEDAQDIVVPKRQKSKGAVPLPSQEYLKACFLYVPETGDIFWNCRPPEHFEGLKQAAKGVSERFNTQFGGKPAGCWMKVRAARYKMIRISSLRQVSFLASRIIWRMMTGEDPGELQVDHEDRNSMNNRWDNLRLANNSQNNNNRVKLRRKNPAHTYLPKGVYPSGGDKFTAHITRNGKTLRLGTFGTVDEAHKARIKAFQEVAGSFACHD